MQPDIIDILQIYKMPEDEKVKMRVKKSSIHNPAEFVAVQGLLTKVEFRKAERFYNTLFKAPALLKEWMAVVEKKIVSL